MELKTYGTLIEVLWEPALSCQVPYSQGKAMADFYLSQIAQMPVTIACVGLLYCKVCSFIRFVFVQFLGGLCFFIAGESWI